MVDLEKTSGKRGRRIALLCGIVIAAAAAVGGWYFYTQSGYQPLRTDSSISASGGTTHMEAEIAATDEDSDDKKSAAAGKEASDKSVAADSAAGSSSSSAETAGSVSSVEKYVSESGKNVSSTISDTAKGSNEWNLLLVNPWHLLPEDFSVELANIENNQQIDARAADDLEEMLADCRSAGYTPYICSSYRMYSKQVSLFDSDVRKYMNQGYPEEEARAKTSESVAIPGTSEHEAGLAVDIVDVHDQILEETQANNGTQKWLMAHCWEYGFILRYPKDKTEITGITYEPWHYRYVGKKAARAMQKSGQCLEEYLGILDGDSRKTDGKADESGE